LEVDPELVIPNRDLSLAEGAISPWSRNAGMQAGWYVRMLEACTTALGFDTNTPVRTLTQEQLDGVLYGLGDRKLRARVGGRSGRGHEYEFTFEGVLRNIERKCSADPVWRGELRSGTVVGDGAARNATPRAVRAAG
jgi:excinuclease ABC subunit A